MQIIKFLYLFVLLLLQFKLQTLELEITTYIQTFRPGLNISRRTLGVTQ